MRRAKGTNTIRVHAHFTNSWNKATAPLKWNNCTVKEYPDHRTDVSTSNKATVVTYNHEILLTARAWCRSETQRPRTGNTHTVTSLSQRRTVHNPSNQLNGAHSTGTRALRLQILRNVVAVCICACADSTTSFRAYPTTQQRYQSQPPTTAPLAVKANRRYATQRK
jgi:hypothetical protein